MLKQIIIIDDLIATGGTAEASAKLVEKSGGKIIVLRLDRKAGCLLIPI